MTPVQLHRYEDLAPRRSAEAGDAPDGRVGRRHVLGLGTALACGALTPLVQSPAGAQDAQPVRYPEPSVVVRDPRFRYKLGNAPIQRLYHGTLWAEGTAWNADYEGQRVPQAASSPRPLIKEAIYRIDAQTGAIGKVADEPFKPNGMCFSHDYTKAYVSDTGASHYPEARAVIWAYDVDGARLRNPRVFTSVAWGDRPGGADGIRCDEDGNVWAAMGWGGQGYDGVHVFAPDGVRIGEIHLPEVCGNLCFGGSKRNRLFMAASQSLYAVHVETRGAHIT